MYLALTLDVPIDRKILSSERIFVSKSRYMYRWILTEYLPPRVDI